MNWLVKSSRCRQPLFIFSVGVTGGEPDLAMARQALAEVSDEQITAQPGVLIGPPGQVAETLLRYRENYGLTYFSVLEPHMTDFAQVGCAWRAVADRPAGWRNSGRWRTAGAPP
jgi:hypothetical protein